MTVGSIASTHRVNNHDSTLSPLRRERCPYSTRSTALILLALIHATQTHTRLRIPLNITTPSAIDPLDFLTHPSLSLTASLHSLVLPITLVMMSSHRIILMMMAMTWWFRLHTPHPLLSPLTSHSHCHDCLNLFFCYLLHRHSGTVIGALRSFFFVSCRLL